MSAAGHLPGIPKRRGEVSLPTGLSTRDLGAAHAPSVRVEAADTNARS